MFSKKQWLIVILISLILLAVGYGLSTLRNKVTNNSFQSGFDAAKQRLAENKNQSATKKVVEIKKVVGEITAINNDKITIKIKPLEPLADPSLDSRVVLVNAATKFYSSEQKDPKEYLAEMQEYQKNIKASKASTTKILAPVTPATKIVSPSRFIKKEISLTDLKVGQRISISAGEDIKNLPEFSALEITLSSFVLVGQTAPLNNVSTSSSNVSK